MIRPRQRRAMAALACLGVLLPVSTSAATEALLERISRARAPCDQSSALEISGQALAPDGVDVMLQLWHKGEDGVGRGVGLRDVQVLAPHRLRGVLAAGAQPGSYRVTLIQRRGKDIAEYRSELMFEVTPPHARVPRITGVSSFLLTAGQSTPALPPGVSPALAKHPTRIAVTGAMLDKVERLWLEGHSNVGLVDIVPQHSCRLLATIPPGAKPGRYALLGDGPLSQVRIQGAIDVLPPSADEAPLVFLIYFAVLGSVFFVGLALAWRAGDVGLKTTRARRNLAWQLGGLLIYLVLLGCFQFFLADWHGGSG